jgi:hypothetical protein
MDCSPALEEMNNAPVAAGQQEPADCETCTSRQNHVGISVRNTPPFVSFLSDFHKVKLTATPLLAQVKKLSLFTAY